MDLVDAVLVSRVLLTWIKLVFLVAMFRVLWGLIRGEGGSDA